MRDGGERLRRFGLRFSKFSIVGLVNWVVDFGMFNLLFFVNPTREPGLSAIYSLVALVCANVSSYLLNTRWTFRERAERSLRERVLFALQALANVGLGYALFLFIVRAIFVYTSIPAFYGGNLAKILSAVVTAIFTYFMLRYFVFSPKRRSRGRL